MKIKLLLLYFFCFVSSLSMGYGRYYGVVTHQNKRPYQEDRFVVIPHIENGNFFGIYDGHGGDKAASFLQRELHKYFSTCLAVSQDPCSALERAFFQAEDYVLQHYRDGATALAVYIDDKNRLHCAWAGDTRLVLEKIGAVAFETTDHKPDNEKELARIFAAGGKVEKWGVYRVGGLAISRSIGDAEIKKNHAGQVIAIPDCDAIQLSDDNHFLIMASDGLWDVISSEEAVKMVQGWFTRKKNLNSGESIVHNKDLDEVARYLQDKAIERGSGDNITVCIVYFDWSESKVSIMQRFWNWLLGE